MTKENICKLKSQVMFWTGQAVACGTCPCRHPNDCYIDPPEIIKRNRRGRKLHEAYLWVSRHSQLILIEHNHILFRYDREDRTSVFYLSKLFQAFDAFGIQIVGCSDIKRICLY